MQRSTPDNEDHRRPESRSVQEIAADSLVGKATSEILMLVPPFTPCNVPLQCDMYMLCLCHWLMVLQCMQMSLHASSVVCSNCESAA